MGDHVSDWPEGSRAMIALDGWAGRIYVPCEIVGHTNKRVRVELLADATIGRTRHLKGAVRPVPPHALRPTVARKGE